MMTTAFVDNHVVNHTVMVYINVVDSRVVVDVCFQVVRIVYAPTQHQVSDGLQIKIIGMHGVHSVMGSNRRRSE